MRKRDSTQPDSPRGPVNIDKEMPSSDLARLETVTRSPLLSSATEFATLDVEFLTVRRSGMTIADSLSEALFEQPAGIAETARSVINPRLVLQSRLFEFISRRGLPDQNIIANSQGQAMGSAENAHRNRTFNEKSVIICQAIFPNITTRIAGR